MENVQNNAENESELQASERPDVGESTSGASVHSCKIFGEALQAIEDIKRDPSG